MIRSIRACKTAADERAVVAKECAVLRNAFRDNDQDYRHRNVAKLMFIHMLGYPTHFGQMECIKLIAAGSFPEKRIGYLGLMLLVDERQEVLMLVTNSLKNDLNHSNQFIVGLALCALGNICTAEMARDLALEVEKLLHNNNSYIRKKAALCSLRIVRKVPDLIDYVMVPATSLLTDKHHGVLISGVKLCTELCQVSEVAVQHYRKVCTAHVMSLIRVLKNLVVSGYAPEYDVNGITDPFLQIRLLRLLGLLGKGDPETSDNMSDILAQVATNTEGSKNAGNAILYECVQTIMSIETIGGLRVLAINILGRFLANRDNNIRYVALNTLVKVVSVDTQAVQRHRTTIVECVKDSDISIQRRALELICALVNVSNVKTLTKELIDYLKVSDPEFKGDLTAKISSLVQRFSPNKQWYIDQMILLMIEAGKYVTPDVTRALVVVISNASELQGYTVRALYRVFQAWNGQESLGQVTIWCIGEYGEMLVDHLNEVEGEEPLTVTESDAVDIVETVLKDTRVSSDTLAFCLTALLKLSSRFSHCADHIKALIFEYKGSVVLELQQRAIEFGSILSKHTDIKAALLERMPVLDEATYYSAKQVEMGVDGNQTATSEPHSNGHVAQPNGLAKHLAPENSLIDLLSFLPDEQPSAPDKSPDDSLLGSLGINTLAGSDIMTSPVHPSSSGGANMLLELLSLGSSPAALPVASSQESAASVQPPSLKSSLLDVQPPFAIHKGSSLTQDVLGGQPHKSPTSNADPFANLNSLSMPVASGENAAHTSIVAMQTNGLKITFEFTKPAGSPQTTIIRATHTNLSSSPYTDYLFQAAVPKFMQLQLEPASSNFLPANGDGFITQIIKATNNMHGQKAIVMKLRVSFKSNGQNNLEQAQVNNFPAGL
ncbi:unnamed protein product [Sphagnum troendelagicum]|uniref:AP-1 complex subunit gamma n=1 Tax=Sphagnum troendelagicum TaxID=128251 RepID=A0ABP0UM62_9BRYO